MLFRSIAWLALARGDRAVVPRPTYQLHAASVRTTGAEVDLVDPLPGPGLRLDLDAVAAKALRQRPQVFEISASAVDHHDSGLAGTPLTELNHMQTPAGHIDEYARGRMLSLDLRHTERRHQRCARGGEVQNNDDG